MSRTPSHRRQVRVRPRWQSAMTVGGFRHLAAARSARLHRQRRDRDRAARGGQDGSVERLREPRLSRNLIVVKHETSKQPAGFARKFPSLACRALLEMSPADMWKARARRAAVFLRGFKAQFDPDGKWTVTWTALTLKGCRHRRLRLRSARTRGRTRGSGARPRPGAGVPDRRDRSTSAATNCPR